MTKSDFLKNNRGIDEGKDLPAEVLEAIFDEIQTNEIVMKDQASASKSDSPQKQERAILPMDMESILLFGKGKKRDGAPETISKTSEDMALKTEAIFANLLRSKPDSKNGTQKNESATKFFLAHHYEHVKQMFQLIWMPILTAISAPLQENDDEDIVNSCLDGFRYALHISCLFDLELETKGLISTLGKFAVLSNTNDIRPKSIESIKALLDVAYFQGNHLGESWKTIVQCISQWEKIRNNVTNLEESRNRGNSERPSPRKENASKPGNKSLLEDVAGDADTQIITISIDRIFTGSAKLSGSAIVEFVRALTETSWDEITNSVDKEQPRMYCLQRLVEISYYNMKRIRVEWSQLWAILGKHFNQVGSYPNTNVAFFAVDKLRQLTMKFLELEELPNFKFQKEFLKPFEEVLRNNVDVKVKDMCLACIQQIVQAKAKNLKSGWKTLFGSLHRASREQNESLATIAFDILKHIFKNSFESIVLNGAYPDFISCVVEFCKNPKLEKIRYFL